METKPALGDLFPEATDEQIERLADFIHGYCAVVWRIYERIKREHPEVIDDLMRNRNMKAKVDCSNK